MEIKIKLNGTMVSDDVPADTLLIDFVRAHGCLSVKRGCETSSCGLCTVLMDDEPVFRAQRSRRAPTAAACTRSKACRKKRPNSSASLPTKAPSNAAFATPASSSNTIALLRENPDPSDGKSRVPERQPVRCSGYEGQLRGIRAFLNSRHGGRVNHE